MKLFKHALAGLLIVALAMLASCSKSGTGTQYIPKEATAVLLVNGSKIGKKIAWESLWSGDLFKGSKKEAEKPEDMGIDILNKFYAYVQQDQRISGGVKTVGILPLSDEKKWADFLKKKYPEMTTSKDGDITIAVLEKNMVAGWKNKMAIVAFSPNGYSDEATTLLTDQVKKSFSLEKDATISKNDKFTQLEKKDYDIGVWVNYERMGQSVSEYGLGAAGMLSAQSRLTKDSYVIGGINFEKGAINGEGIYFINPTMVSIMKKLSPDKIDDDLLKRIPSGQLAGVVSYHFNPEGVKTMIDSLGYTNMLNSQLQEQGLTIDGILNAFTGDIMIAATDVKNEERTYSYPSYDGDSTRYTSHEPSANWLATFKIKDQAALDKVIQLALQEEALTVKGDHLFEMDGTYLSAKDGYAVITQKQESLQSFYSATGSVPAVIPDEVKKNPMGIFIDFKALAPLFQTSNEDSPKEIAAMANMQKLLDHVMAYSTKVSGDHSEFTFKASFQNKDENSLMQIIKLINQFSEAGKSDDVASR